MENKFKKVILHKSEKADETWVNPDHIVAVTPDPKGRYMVIVLDALDLSGFTGGPRPTRSNSRAAGSSWDSR